MLVDMIKAMQKEAENVNCLLKLPVKTRYAYMVTSLESVVDARPAFVHISCDFLHTQLLGSSITIMRPTLL